MKIKNLQRSLTALAVSGLALSATVAGAQSAPVIAPVQVSVSAPTLQLSSGAQQVLQLSQAKINDDTIVAFIRNSLISYNLSANEIIYLRQQGVSNPVISAMLNHAPGAPAPAPAVPAPTIAAPIVETDNLPVYTAPATTTVVEPAPATVYYDDPYYYDPYYYGVYPVGGIYLGGGWGWGGGWHGGYHGGGGWHGGGGGFHGGGGSHGGGHR